MGQYEKGWKLFRFDTKINTRDKPDGKWIDRGDVDIPKGGCHKLAAAFVQAGGALDSAEAKEAVGGVHPKDAKGRLCRAIEVAISRANSKGKPNVTVPLPIEHDRHGKSYQCVVQFGYVIQDDDGRHVFQSAEERYREQESNSVQGA